MGTEESLHCFGITLAIAVVSHDDGREESEAVLREQALLDLVIGNDVGLSLCIGQYIPYQFLKILHGPWI